MQGFDCQKCGACCSYSGEVTVTPEDKTPKYLTRSVRNRAGYDEIDVERGLRRMERIGGKGMAQYGGKCIALRGVIGTKVECQCYAKRPEVCREFAPGSSGCLTARHRAGISDPKGFKAA